MLFLLFPRVFDVQYLEKGGGQGEQYILLDGAKHAGLRVIMGFDGKARRDGGWAGN